MRLCSGRPQKPMRRRHAGLLTLLLCFVLTLTPAPVDGLDASGAAGLSEVVISSEAEALEALHLLEDGQELFLKIPELHLNATVTITANDVAIHGAPSVTRVHAPFGSGAFKIWNSRNMTVTNLEISDCSDTALGIYFDSPLRSNFRAQSAEHFHPSENAESKDKDLDCVTRITNCWFKRNEGELEAAIYAHGCALHIENTTFSNNFGPNLRGANSIVSRDDAVQPSGRETRMASNSLGEYTDVECNGPGAFVYPTLETYSEPRKASWGPPDGTVYAFAGAVTITKSNFQENRVEGSGGAVKVENSPSVTVTRSVFASNQGDGNGGALDFSDCRSVSVTGSSFTSNQADRDGGALCVELCPSVTVTESFFDHNQAELDGGALHFSDCPTASVTESRLQHNRAEQDGGALKFTRCHSVSVNGSTLNNNTADKDGGAVNVGESHAVYVSHSWFENNSAAGNGGGVNTQLVDAVLLSDSVFEENMAVGKQTNGNGGGLYAETVGQVKISMSTFDENQAALQDGGAVYAKSVDSLPMIDSDFDWNSAQGSGGAVRLISTNWITQGTYFFGNRAKWAGGAASLSDGSWVLHYNNSFMYNDAVLGGAVSLDESAELIGVDRKTMFLKWVSVANSFISCYGHEAVGRTLLESNVAVRGGGVFCQRCTIQIRSSFTFVGNIGLASGGGMHVVDSDSLLVDGHSDGGPQFLKNIAGVGGGLFVKDCTSAKISADFEGNRAIDGGGFFLASEFRPLENYNLTGMSLKSNRAENLGGALVAYEDPPALSWQQLHENTWLGGEIKWLQGEEDRQGKGGAGYIALRNRRDDSIVTLSLDDVEVEQNSAGIGGGLYIENRGIDSVSSKCDVKGSLPRSCLAVVFKDVRIVKNTAYIAGGGLFMFSPKRIETYGLSESSMFDTACEEQPDSSDRTICLRENRLLGDDALSYGVQFATGAWSLTVEGVEGVLNLTAGDRLTVRRNDSNAELSGAEGLTVVVKDWLNQTITGDIADARLAVVLLSKAITGDRRYEASNGMVKINSTAVAGYNISDVVVIQSDDSRQINVTIEFRTEPCQGGELPTEKQSSCFRCSSQAYSFVANSTTCRECEKNAQCSGTTELVPDDGYWHSTPFSPYIRRCPSKSACSFQDRKANLSQYYNDTSIGEKLRPFEADSIVDPATWIGSYNQCAAGYEGVLCGACTQGYGHSAGGGCKLCSQGLTAARLTAVLSVGVLFLVLTTKVILGVDGVLKYTVDELRKERSAVTSTLLQCHRATEHDERKAETSTDDATPVGASSRSRGIEGAESADQSSEEGPSAAAAEVRPLLQRTDQSIEDPAAEGSSVHAETQSAAAVAASGLLVATYNILFNYVQLSTAALSLSVNWRTALNQLLAINGVLGRVMRLEFLPFDCTFSDRRHDVGTPNSLLVLWFRILFPFMAVAFYLTVVGVIKVVRGEIKTSKYKVDPLPSLRLLFLVVYLAYCIDIVSDLLQVFNCYDLSADYLDDHPYNYFEHLDLVSVWMQDTSVTCWRDAHQVSAVLAAIGLVVCSMIIVFMVAIVAKGSREGRLNQPQFVRRYGILFLGYRQEGLALHWESVITVRRMLLAAIEVYSGNRETSGVHIGMLAIVIFAALAVHDIVQPFEEETEEETFPSYAGSEVRLITTKRWRHRWVEFNRAVTMNGMEGASLFMALSFFLVAGCISDARANEVEANLLLVACFVLNAVYFAFMVYRLWYGLHLYLDVLADERNLVFTNAVDRATDRSTYLVVKVWKLATFKREENVDALSAVASA